MTFDDAFRYIESFTNLERVPGTSMRPYRLDRMKVLLEQFGNPQSKVRTIHVSGSKGKGSTGLYAAACLEEAGYRTGLYTSPHVSSYRERITLAGRYVSDSLLVECIELIRGRIEQFDPDLLPGQQKPTTFELLTLLAYLVFERIPCSWAVIETGIGGRLDATNVLMPEATLHTPVELEHTEVLGDTITLIAGEKAGIIKPGVPAFCGYQQEEATAVFKAKAGSMGSEIRFLAEEVPSLDVDTGTWGTKARLTLKNGDEIVLEPGMPGRFQAENAALAFIAVDWLLAKEGLDRATRRESIARAIRQARLPGRMELVQRNPPVMIDAAHTPSSARRLIEAFANLYPEKGVLVFGSVSGKNPAAMAEVLCPALDSVVISTPGTFKPSDPQHVYDCFCRFHRRVELIRDPAQAYRRAVELAGDSKPILVTGSFYMISEIRALFTESVGAKVV